MSENKFSSWVKRMQNITFHSQTSRVWVNINKQTSFS